MSEEKLYAIKNDEGEWLDQNHIFGPGAWAAPDKDERENVAKRYGAHVVALVEEPKKVVLSKEQAQVVKEAHNAKRPASYIILKSNDEELLMNAYVNGFTVAKEKKWRLPVPSAWCGDSNHYWHKESDGTLTWSILAGRSEGFEFSRNEIAEYGMNGFKKEEVTDDDE